MAKRQAELQSAQAAHSDDQRQLAAHAAIGRSRTRRSPGRADDPHCGSGATGAEPKPVCSSRRGNWKRPGKWLTPSVGCWSSRRKKSAQKQADLECRQAQLEQARAQIEATHGTLQAKQSEVAAGMAALAAGRAELEERRAELDSERQRLADTRGKLDDLKLVRKELDEKTIALGEERQSLAQERAQLAVARAQLDVRQAAVSSAQEQLDFEKTQLERQLESARQSEQEIDSNHKHARPSWRCGKSKSMRQPRRASAPRTSLDSASENWRQVQSPAGSTSRVGSQAITSRL